MADNFDFSDLGPTSNSTNKEFDFSDLGPYSDQSATQNLSNQADKQRQTVNKPSGNNFLSSLNNSSNNVVSPNAFINIALSNNKLLQSAKEVASSAGKLGSFYNPELMESPGLISGIVNSLGRIGMGTVSSTAIQAPNINSIEDLKNSADRNLRLNALAESPVSAIHGVGGMAELFNPVKYAEQQRNLIEQGANAADIKRQEAYLPVNNKYNDTKVTNYPEKFLDFDESDKQYFPSNIKKSINKFNNSPNFKNLHDMQSLMGGEAAAVAGIPELRDKYQALTNSRNSVKQNIQDFLSNDQLSLSQYKEGERISRDEYYPYLSTPNLKAASEGRKTDFNPNKAVKEVNSDLDRKENYSIPKDHPVIPIIKDLESQISKGHAMQYVAPMAAGTVLGSLLHPGFGSVLGGIGGALSGAGFGHYLEPSIFKATQEPWLRNSMLNLRSLYYPSARNWIANNS